MQIFSDGPPPELFGMKIEVRDWATAIFIVPADLVPLINELEAARGGEFADEFLTKLAEKGGRR